MKKRNLFVVLFLCVILNINLSENQRILPGYEKDLVPDESTAIKIAEAIFYSIEGEAIYDNKPFTATSRDSVWTVKGTLPDGWVGGVPSIIIRKSDCKIIKVSFRK